MSLHSANYKIGTTEILSQSAGLIDQSTSGTNQVVTTTVQRSSPVRTVRTVVTEAPVTTVYTNTGFTSGTSGISEVRSGIYTGTNATYTYSNLPHTHIKGAIGTVIIRPVEGKFLQDDGYAGMINPYCKLKIGWHTNKGLESLNGGGCHVVWNDVITLDRKAGDKFAKFKCKDKNRVILGDSLGSCKIDLENLAKLGKVYEWFTLWKGDRKAAEVLLDVQYVPVADIQPADVQSTAP